MIETSQEHEIFSYEPFTQHAFYKEINRNLVERAVGSLPTGRPLTIVDLGSGTGAITQMVAEALHRRGMNATIIGVEPSADAIARAERRLAGSAMNVRFVQGDAADLARLGVSVDALFFCNAIHLVPDKNEAIQKIAEVLAPGGLFVFNSSFFTGAYAPGSETFYRLWTRRAIGWLRREHPEVKLSRDEKALAMQWLSQEEYTALLQKHGFDVLHCSLDEAHMDLHSWQDIGHYWLFIEGALPGAPLEAGAEALRQGSIEAFQELGLSYVPRNWLQIVARLS
jgi:ubiquinone/menaquinone biosynthesis C-methylase UbiE